MPKASARLVYPGIIFDALIRMHLGRGRWWFAARREAWFEARGEAGLEVVWRLFAGGLEVV